MLARMIAAGVLAVVALSGCQYTAEPMAIGSFNVYSSYDDKVPGKFLLYVDGAQLNKDVKPSNLNCAAHTYPLHLADSFASSTRQTVANLVGEIEVVDKPVDRETLAAMSARGMIIVRGEQVIPKLRVVPGFWTANMESDVEIVASITVDGRSGRLLGTTVSGRGNAQGDAGALCEGGATSLAGAASDAMRMALTRIGEEFTNSERVRLGK